MFLDFNLNIFDFKDFFIFDKNCFKGEKISYFLEKKLILR